MVLLAKQQVTITSSEDEIHQHAGNADAEWRRIVYLKLSKNGLSMVLKG
jgi:hypothetical protein